MMVLGPILVVVVVFFPKGLAGQGERVWSRLTSGGRSAP